MDLKQIAAPAVEGALPYGLTWGLERPMAAALFLFPLIVLLLSFRRTRPRSAWLSTARFFPDQGKKAGSERRRSLPLSRAAAIAGMCAATLALMGPTPAPGEPGSERFVCVVDRSPSMYLASGTDDPARTRLSAAVEGLSQALRDRSRKSSRGIELMWVDGTDPAADATAPLPWTAGLPAEWNGAPRRPRSEPRFGAFDKVGVIWITDRVPVSPGQWAGYAASGGASVPGAIGTTRAEGGEPATLLWSGVSGAAPTVSSTGPQTRVVVDRALPGPLIELVTLWAADRGAAVTANVSAAELEIVQVAGDNAAAPTGQAARVGRDGWSALVRAVSSGDPSGLPPWLVSEDGTSALSSGPGRVECRIAEFVTEPSDDAAFAVSIASLLDGAILPHPDVVPLAERQAAGARGVSLPDLSLPLDELDPRTLERLSRDAAGRTAGALLVAAAMAGAAALWLRLVGR